MKCDLCAKQIETTPDKRGSARMPSGWKRFHDKLWCHSCWSGAYVLRALAFPLSGPLLPITWKEFQPLLNAAWAQSTELSNWIVTELAKADVVRSPDMNKCPPAPKIYLYPLARARFPDMTPSSIATVERMVRGRYNKSRLDVIWRANKSLQRFRYPVPYPVPSQAWSARWLNETDRVPIVSVRLGAQRIDLRLGTKSGQFARQSAHFEGIINGSVLPGTLEFYRQTTQQNGQRHPLNDGKRWSQVMVKLCCWVPKTEKLGQVLMKVSTATDCFIRAQLAHRDDWILQADHVWRWIAEYNSRRWHLDEDRKFEKRWPKHRRQQMNNVMGIWSDKHHRRLATWVHESTAHLIGYAKRNRVGQIDYDDSVRQFADDISFPWHSLKTTLQSKCEQHSITFRHLNASGEVTDKPIDPLAGDPS